jgi:hypothetical protein
MLRKGQRVDDSHVGEGRWGRGLPTPRPQVSIAPIPHLCLRLTSRLWSWEALRRSEVVGVCSAEDMAADAVVVVRVWLLLMVMTSVLIGGFGFSGLR